MSCCIPSQSLFLLSITVSAMQLQLSSALQYLVMAACMIRVPCIVSSSASLYSPVDPLSPENADLWDMDMDQGSAPKNCNHSLSSSNLQVPCSLFKVKHRSIALTQQHQSSIIGSVFPAWLGLKATGFGLQNLEGGPSSFGFGLAWLSSAWPDPSCGLQGFFILNPVICSPMLL